MAVNKAICDILKYERVLGNAISIRCVKWGFNTYVLNLLMDNFTCQEAFCLIILEYYSHKTD